MKDGENIIVINLGVIRRAKIHLLLWALVYEVYCLFCWGWRQGHIRAEQALHLLAPCQLLTSVFNKPLGELVTGLLVPED